MNRYQKYQEPPLMSSGPTGRIRSASPSASMSGKFQPTPDEPSLLAGRGGGISLKSEASGSLTPPWAGFESKVGIDPSVRERKD